MRYIKLTILNIVLVMSLSGCVETLMLAGTATSTAMTAQEVDEKYDGSFTDYIVDKAASFYNYLSGN
jgi:hypothetical protein